MRLKSFIVEPFGRVKELSSNSTIDTLIDSATHLLATNSVTWNLMKSTHTIRA